MSLIKGPLRLHFLLTGLENFHQVLPGFGKGASFFSPKIVFDTFWGGGAPYLLAMLGI